MSRGGIWIWLLLAGVLVCAAASIFLQDSPYVELSGSGGFTPNGEFSSADVDTVRSPRYGSFSGADARTGTLTSASFNAGFAVELAIDGYPAHPGESVRIESLDGLASYVLPLPDVRERWTHFVIPMPLNWIGRNVRLVATDDSSAYQGWIGVADLRRAGLLHALTNDIRFMLLLMSALATLIFLPCVAAARAVCRRFELPAICGFPATLMIAGLFAELIFFTTMISDVLATMIEAFAGVAAVWFTVRTLRDPDARADLQSTDFWMPFAATAACALVYLIAIDLTDRSTAGPANLLPLLDLPIDNLLPKLLADHIWQHLPPKPFVLDWLSSDRPPLQAGFDLIDRIYLPWWADSTARYEGAGLLVQSTALGTLFCLARLCRASNARALAIVAIAMFSGFFYVNSVFIWPKLVAAAYLATACAFAIVPGKLTIPRAVGVGIGTALALLSHGGVAFAIPALLIAFIVWQRRSSARSIALAVAAMAVVLAPWSWYQHVYDPPGDRLLKWFVAGHVAVSDVPFSTLLKHAYLDVPPATTAAIKATNVSLVVLGLPNSALTAAQREFFNVRDAIGATLLPFLAALFLIRWRRFRAAGLTAWIVIASTLVWCLVMEVPYATTVHQGSYFTMLLTFLAGGLIATEFWPLFAVVFMLQLYDFMHVWLAPFNITSVANVGGIVTLLVCCGAAAGLAVCGRRAIGRTDSVNETVRAWPAIA